MHKIIHSFSTVYFFLIFFVVRGENRFCGGQIYRYFNESQVKIYKVYSCLNPIRAVILFWQNRDSPG